MGGVVGSSGPPENVAPKMLPPNIAKAQLLIDPQDPQYKVALPPAMKSAGLSFWAMIKVCVSKDGAVTDAKIIRGADPTLDPQIIAKVKIWKYKPYQIDGRPVPFCFMLRYDISVQK